MEFHARRSPVLATTHAAATSQPLATQAAHHILAKGGNAADAAVAAAAALNVTEPCMTGVGGDVFALFYKARTKTVEGLNGSGRSPAALTRQLAAERAGGGAAAAGAGFLDAGSVDCVTVPGAPAAWADVLERWGTMPLAEVLAPAIRLADEGYAVHPVCAISWAECEFQLTRWGDDANPGARALLPRAGAAPQAGDVVRNPELAQTFRELAAGGKDGFYRGRIADAVVAAVGRCGGVLSHEDLASHTSTFVEPLTADFGGHTVHELPPNGQGLVALIALRVLSILEAKLRGCARDSPEYLHVVAEALRLAFAEGAAVIGDPGDPAGEVEAARWAEQLSDARAAELAARIVDGVAMDDSSVAPPAGASETVYLTTVDASGNGCSFINSNFQGFGSGIVPTGCGFSLQNRGANFCLEAGHPNELGPRRRPYHTIIPGMLTRRAEEGDGDELVATFGVMGGFMQPQGHVQVLLNMLLHGMDPQAALDYPRLRVEAALIGARGALQNPRCALKEAVELHVEEGIPEETLAALRNFGHRVVGPVKGAARRDFGKGQIIQVKRDEGGARVLWAGSDGRGDGMALGL